MFTGSVKMQFIGLATIFILISHYAPISPAPTDTAAPGEQESANSQLIDTGMSHGSMHHHKERKNIDYYEYRHVVAEGVQRALDECRQKFKWSRWNCPKKAFLDILDKDEFSVGQIPLPSNKEFGLTRALIASGIVLSMIRSCSIGTNGMCGCTNPTIVPANDSNFAWAGCDEIVKFGFKVAKIYLDSKDNSHGHASRLIDAHNYEAGQQAVKQNMRRKCKCHGTSGTCQFNTCWTVVPDMSEVGEHLKWQYLVAAKVGAVSAKETDSTSLTKELSAISPDKLVFADASPDYCYENKQLGINGTLGRYCSRTKHRADGTEVSRSERDSCYRLCTKCGYKIKRERINVEKQCDCRFVYCCRVECKRCPHVEETFKCVRHS